MADLFEAALVVGGFLQLPALALAAGQAQPGSRGLRHQQHGFPLTQPRPLQNALTEHVIPKLPDVTQIPDSSWAGWDPIFQELQVDRNNVAQVQETIGRCQATLTNLLQAAIMNGQQAAFEAAHLGDQQVCGASGQPVRSATPPARVRVPSLLTRQLQAASGRLGDTAPLVLHAASLRSRSTRRCVW